MSEAEAKAPNNGIVVGDTVSFLPNGRAKARVTGKVAKVIPPVAKVRGASTFLEVECTDNITRKVRPGGATKVG